MIAFDFSYLKKPILYYQYSDDYHCCKDEAYCPTCYALQPDNTKIDECEHGTHHYGSERKKTCFKCVHDWFEI